MTQKSGNPFAANRFEYEQKNVYYLPKEIISRLSEKKSAYLFGTRGCGKTTFLKSFSWLERIENPSLRLELGSDPFKDRIVGLYIRFPHYHFGLVQKWLGPTSGDMRASLFSLYIDMVWLESAIEAVLGLKMENIEDFSRFDEKKCIEGLFSVPTFRSLIEGEAADVTLRQVQELIRKKRERLEELAITKTKLNPEKLKREVPFPKIGELGRHAAPYLLPKSEQSWHFKVCFDETEILDEFERGLMNTLVRLSEAPLSYLVCFVREDDFKNAKVLEPNIGLQAADVNLVALDGLEDSRFQSFAEGVVEARLRGYLSMRKASFKLEEMFGKLDINNLLTKTLRESENKEAQELLIAAKHSGLAGKKGSKALPVYETFLASLAAAKGISKKDKIDRKFKSEKVRKQMVAVYVFLSRRYRKNGSMYAYAEMIRQLSDGCIRDFLMILSEIYKATRKPVAKFLRGEISPEFQDKGIQKASAEKWAAFSRFVIFNVEASKALVDRIGMLTSLLQGPRAGYSAIKAPERGKFRLSANAKAKGLEHVIQMVRGAAEAGYIKILKDKDQRLEFRIHCALAPKFQCSYRGAYYAVPVDEQSFVDMVLCDEKKFREKYLETWAKDDYESNGSQSQLPLPGVQK